MGRRADWWAGKKVGRQAGRQTDRQTARQLNSYTPAPLKKTASAARKSHHPLARSRGQLDISLAHSYSPFPSPFSSLICPPSIHPSLLHPPGGKAQGIAQKDAPEQDRIEDRKAEYEHIRNNALIHPLEMGDLNSCFTRLTLRSSTGLPILDSSRRA